MAENIFKKIKKYLKDETDTLLSQWTSSQTVEMNDGTTLDETVNGIRADISKLETNKVNTTTTINKKPLSSNIELKAGDVGADASGTANSIVSTHNSSNTSHSDIRNLITGLTTRLNTLADSDDATLDQISELVAYIKANRSLIESVTTTKVNVSDIVNNLTTNATNKPLSAAQGVVIKSLIDSLQTGTHTHSNKSVLDNTSASFTTALSNKLNGIATGAQVNTITGVKGSSETNYRTGNINLTPANLGITVVNNTADANKSVAYADKAFKASYSDIADQADYATQAYKDILDNNFIYDYIRTEHITNTSAINTTGGFVLDAVEKNASVAGTLANQIAELNTNLIKGHLTEAFFDDNSQCVVRVADLTGVSISNVVSVGGFGNYSSLTYSTLDATPESFTILVRDVIGITVNMNIFFYIFYIMA